MNLNPKDDEEIEIDMSPMIDMVFLLLIFFLVASTIIDKKPTIDVPTAAFAVPPKVKIGRAMISVNEKDEIRFGIRDQVLTIPELTQRLKAAIDLDPKLRIQIRAGSMVKYEMNEKIMKACGDAGATDLIYAAYEGESREAY